MNKSRFKFIVIMSIYIEDDVRKVYYESMVKYEIHIKQKINHNINNLIKEDQNLLDGKFKEILTNDKIVIGFIMKTFKNFIMMHLIILSQKPEITLDGNIYIHYGSVINTQKYMVKVHQSDLHTTIHDLFIKTFDRILLNNEKNA